MAQCNLCKVIHESGESSSREDTGFTEFFLKGKEFMNLKRMLHWYMYWLCQRRCRCQFLSINLSLKHGFNVREKFAFHRVILFVMPLQFLRNTINTYRIPVCWKWSFWQTFCLNSRLKRLCSFVASPLCYLWPQSEYLSRTFDLREFKTSRGICHKSKQ